MDFIDYDDQICLMDWFHGQDKDPPVYKHIPEFYQKKDQIDFAKFILKLKEILIEANFNALEDLFSDNFWEKEPEFMERVLQ